MKPLEFSHIFIIESLRVKNVSLGITKDDELTGTKLFNRVIQPRMAEKGLDNNSKLISVSSKLGFLDAISSIKNQMLSEHINPIIHLEMHGAKTGLQVSNFDIITWEELQPKLIELNVLSQNNLFISMATCYGGYIFNAISPKLRAPFWGFIGPFDETDEDEVLISFTKFYDKLLVTLNFNEAERVLQEDSLPNLPKFRFQNLEYVFQKIYKNYEEKYLTPKMVEHRISLIAEQSKNLSDFKGWSVEDLKEMAKKIILGKNDEIRQTIMTRFYMLDIFPNQNA